MDIEEDPSEQNKFSLSDIIGALTRRIISQMYFRNILAVMMVVTMCIKELQDWEVSENFYMLVGLVIGMYFKQGSRSDSSRGSES